MLTVYNFNTLLMASYQVIWLFLVHSTCILSRTFAFALTPRTPPPIHIILVDISGKFSLNRNVFYFLKLWGEGGQKKIGKILIFRYQIKY